MGAVLPCGCSDQISTREVLASQRFWWRVESFANQPRMAKEGARILSSLCGDERVRDGRVGGAYAGRASCANALVRCSAMQENAEWLSHAIELLSPNKADGDQPDCIFDMIGGSAGAIVVALDAFEASGDKRAIASARIYADRLVDQAERMALGGVGWRSVASKPLTGMAHGGAGIGLALIRLGEVCGETRYAQCGWSAWAYERALFDATEQNWPDLRDNLPGPVGRVAYGTAWCHGAPGIGIARSGLPASLLGVRERAEIEVAIRCIREAGQSNDSLCHGTLGAIDMLLEVSQAVQEPGVAEVESRTTDVLDAMSARGYWRSGLGATNGEALGLLTGIAGVGYGLLRVAFHGRGLESVLACGGKHSRRATSIGWPM